MRVRLDCGQQVDLNQLIRKRVIDPAEPGGLFLSTGASRQHVAVISRPRRFGGCQWYFVCPDTGQLASVLWMPPGARHYASRHAWAGQAAYSSQFEMPWDRAHRAQAKIKTRLIGNLNPDDWELPPKPKWMRWRTYNRMVERFDICDGVIHCELFSTMGRALAGDGSAMCRLLAKYG
jgi:hypothetical protein